MSRLSIDRAMPLGAFALSSALIAVALAGCGGGDGSGGSSASTASTSTTQSTAQARARRAAKPVPEPKLKHLPPIHHHDSGGGSGQFRAKGGDNSIQNFGQEASVSEFERAATALHTYLDARLRLDPATACLYMSRQLQRSAMTLARQAHGPHDDCPVALAVISVGVPRQALAAAAVANVGSFRFRGDRGFLVYRGAQHANYVMPMVREGGGWKVTLLAGGPLF